MKVSIIPVDGAVYVDGYSFAHLDLSGIPPNVHALQWEGESGWIEFENESEFCRPPNQSISELPEWATLAIEKFEKAKAEETARVQAFQNQPQPVVRGVETL